MQLHAGPFAYALFCWWFTTGVVLYLDGLPPRTFKWSMLGATALFAVALGGIALTRDDTTVRGAYTAFTLGLLAWGWQEISFYTGYLTGIRKVTCADDCAGFRHFGHAVQASLWHELGILASAAAVTWCTWGGRNQVALWTFAILWWMHQSAKLNVFLGVRNLNEHFLPEHLRFLRSFLRKRPMNLLFPVSVTVSTVAAVLLLQRAYMAGDSTFDAAAYSFLGGLMILAILEHWFLVLPIPAAALWAWCLRSRATVRPTHVDVITGYLGAGKTTFLRRRLASLDPEERTVVLVNDFGDVGVDGSLLQGRGAEVVELPNGCLCCSLRDDLARQLREIVVRYGPTRVLIEPSGVAETASLLRTLYRADLADVVGDIRVLTMIDASTFLADFARMPRYFEAQAGAAPVVVVNKADLVTVAELQTIEDTLRPLNPAARIVAGSYGSVPVEALSAAPVARPAGPRPDESHARLHPEIGLGFRTWSAELREPVDESSLRELLRDVAAGRFGYVARAKGIALVARGWVHFDVAGARVTVAAFGAREGEQGRAVAIGNDLDGPRLLAAFLRCRTRPDADQHRHVRAV